MDKAPIGIPPWDAEEEVSMSIKSLHPTQKAGGFLDFLVNFGSSSMVSGKFISCFLVG